MTVAADFTLSGVEAFTAAIAQVNGPAELKLLGDDTPRLASYRFGQCRISRIWSPPFSLQLSKARTCDGMDDQVFVTVDRSSLSTFDTPSVRFANTGDAIMIADRSYASLCASAEASERTIFSFPRALLPVALQRALPHAVTLECADGGMPAVFHHMVMAAAREQERLNAVERSRLQRSLIGLIGDLIAGAATGGETEGPLGLASLRARAMALIETELFSLQGIEDLSDRLNCSTRHLYNAFGERRTTPARYIWKLRLDRAREQILSQGSEVSITEVAYACGFQSYSHFSRAFKRQFGTTPQGVWSQREGGATKVAS